MKNKRVGGREDGIGERRNKGQVEGWSEGKKKERGIGERKKRMKNGRKGGRKDGRKERIQEGQLEVGMGGKEKNRHDWWEEGWMERKKK